MIENAIIGAYWIPAQITGLPQWELRADEAKYLTDAAVNVVKSMDSKRGKAITAMLDKYLPGASLAVAALVITVPRIKFTQRHYETVRHNAGRQQFDAATRAGDNAATGGDTGTHGPASEWDQPITGARPLTASDLAYFGGRSGNENQ